MRCVCTAVHVVQVVGAYRVGGATRTREFKNETLLFKCFNLNSENYYVKITYIFNDLLHHGCGIAAHDCIVVENLQLSAPSTGFSAAEEA